MSLLSEVKEVNPTKLVEYARARDIESEPVFVWWSIDVLKKQKILRNKLYARMTKKIRSLALNYLQLFYKLKG